MLAEILAEVGAAQLALLWLGVMAAAILRYFTGFGLAVVHTSLSRQLTASHASD